MPMSYIWTYYLFNRLNKLSHRTNPLPIPGRVQYVVLGATCSIEGILADFPIPILQKIGVEPTREA